MSTTSSQQYYARLGKRMRALREAAGLSQAALGARLDRSPSAIDRYEMGQRRIPLSDLVRLSDVLRVPLDALLGHPAGVRRPRAPEPTRPAAAREISAEHRRLLRALDRRLAYPAAHAPGGRVAEPASAYASAVASVTDKRLREWAAHAGLTSTAGAAALRRYAELVVDGITRARTR